MDVVVMLVAAGFAGMGALGLVRPAAVVAPLGARVDTSEARTEVRAVYGGFGLAVAVVLVSAGFADPGSLRDGALVTVAIALGGMAVGRLVGALLERPGRLHPTVTCFAVEAAAAALLLMAYAHGR